MRLVLGVLALCLILGGTAMAQSLDANRLAIHNGSEYYITGFDHNTVNGGAGKYFPSFTHWSAAGTGAPTAWPWQLRGWIWAGMQATINGPTWYWATALFYSVDNPWSTNMTFNYPVNYCLGLEPHSGAPWIVYGTSGLPATVPSAVAGKEMVFPSSYGGFDAYLNMWAFGAATWNIPSTAAYYGWSFAFTVAPTNFIALPSVQSVYQYTWEWLGPFGQYQLFSGNEMDCTLANGGNKGRIYSIGKIGDTGYFYYWNNACTGVDGAWAMSLLVNDAVTVPVNVPGAPNASNPFVNYGFDAGVTTLTPLASSGSCFLKAMYEDVFNPGTGRALLAASPYSGPCVPYGPAGFRLAHAWDPITAFFAGIYFVWGAQPPGIVPGYPAAQFGTTVAGASIGVPIPPDPSLLCLELKYSGYSTNGRAPTASFQVCYF